MLLFFKNSNVLNALIPLYPSPSLNWVIKLPLDWGTVFHIEIIKRRLPENNLLRKYDDSIKIIHLFRFCNSVITRYSCLWYPFFVTLSKFYVFFCIRYKWLTIDDDDDWPDGERYSVQMNQTHITKNCYMTGENLKISHMCPKWRHFCQNRVERNCYTTKTGWRKG